ncbi:dehydrogenase/reductase SDR family member 12 isoform X3 [Mesoplodon densirostris]|uniref:dehydrogenase/reductase SDR family member 12 isoform X3 n=1 Tax=Mesoplodon densirostris TaxID=48708 RepID=UPI0028DB3486|nr:dehydrogenase/reductase SDR family member 12 isoform X3 [Mesoplodon densirostris]
MLLYRSAVWFAKGLREYTKSGYESASKDFIPDDLEVQVPGRAFMVTGGNSGIGKATAFEIAKRGGTVHLVCRDQNRAEGARGEIIRESGNQINNAGCMVNERELTEDGLEKNFATNTLGVYVLTTALIPVLEKEHDPRVITVSSGGMLVQKLNTDDLQSERTAFDGTMVYAQNKRQQVVLTELWARAHPNVHFSCMHPGWVDTPGVRLSMPGFHARLGARLRSEAQGADTVLWLALAPKAAVQPSGRFFQDRKPVPTHLPLARTSSSPAEEEKLIEILEELAQRFK